MSHDEEWWWWASRKGDLKTLDGKELRAHLRSSVLAPDVLVWKEGWAGWLQAAEVALLADALPRHKLRTPVEPRLDASVVSPPAPPLERYKSAPAAQPQAPKRTLLGLPKPTLGEPPRPGGPPRPAGSPLRGVSSRPPPEPGGRAPGAPPRPLSSSSSSTSGPGRPPPPRRPSTRPPPPPRGGRPPPPPRVAAPVEEELLVEIDAELEEVSSPDAAAGKANSPEPGAAEPIAITEVDATKPDAAPAPAPEDAAASSVRPSLIINVGSGTAGDKPPAEKKLEPIVPVASDPDNEAPTQVTAPLEESLDPIVPVPSDPDQELPTLMIPPMEGKEPIVPVPSDPENELPTQVIDNSDLDSELPTHIKLDAPDEPPLPSWSDELDRGSAPNVAAPPPAPIPAFADPRAGAQHASADPFADGSDGAAQSLDPAFLGPAPGARRRVALVVGIVGSALVVLLIAGAVSFFRGSGSSSSAASATPAKAAAATSGSAQEGAAGAAKAPSHAACTVAKHGSRLADKTAVRVPPYLATAPGGQVALGFATTPTAAIGLKVDPTSLDPTQEFSRDGKHNVLGVVPLVRDKKLDFAVDREGSPLQNAHTVDASPPFIIGVTKAGVARAIGYGEPETIWPGAGDQRITEPRVVSVHGVGHAVTFRRGGRDGEVRGGWLTPDGEKKTDLVEIKADGLRVGTPTLAVNNREVLVSFAARPSDDAAWTVRLAHAPLGKAPRSSQQFELPGGGPGGDAISPAAVGLPGGRWLLQWTEGKPGSRTVRAQTLDASLAPSGDPITLSPDGKDSGQGALWRVGDHVLSVFLVRSDSGYELWGSGLSCL